MLRIYTYAHDHLVLFTDSALENAPRDAVWCDLINPTPEESRLVESHLAIDLPTRDEMEEIEPSARLYQEDGAEFMTMTALSGLDTNLPCKTPITFIIKGQALVTVRYAEPKPFDIFVAHAQRNNGSRFPCGNAEMLLTGLMEAMIDRMADALERVASEIDGISHNVFRSKAAKATQKTRDLQHLIEQIGQKGDFLTMLRESMVSISRIVAYHTALEGPIRKQQKEARQRLKLIQRDATSLGDHASFLSGKINFLLDATLGLINLEQNQIIKIFTIASVVFLPPTLVASVYGMNFAHMPELDWDIGYPLAIALMILSAVMPSVYFRRKGWL